MGWRSRRAEALISISENRRRFLVLHAVPFLLTASYIKTISHHFYLGDGGSNV
jgi:hypothetical protein